MRIVYMGTPAYAVKPLEALYRAGYEIAAVVTQPDKPKGRHGELSMPEVKQKAQELGLMVLQPLKASEPGFIDEIRALEPEAIVVAAYGQILKPELLELPRLGCINLHASLLPRWRGASPIAAAIMAGDEFTGITVMQMDAGIDTGDILMQEKLPIGPEDTTESLTDKLSELGARLIVSSLSELQEGKIVPVRQEDVDIPYTYAKILKKEEGELSPELSPIEAERRIRGLTPWPGAYMHIKGKLFKIYKAQLLEGTGAKGDTKDQKARDIGDSKEAGSLFALDDGLYLSLKGGSLRLLEVQLEGKKRMSAADFLRGSRGFLEN